MKNKIYIAIICAFSIVFAVSSGSCLRRFVAEGFIPHVPNGSHILVYYPNVANLIKNGVTAEQSRAYQLSRSRS